jgi:predicted DNA-binding transcriptional regulator AlpA
MSDELLSTKGIADLLELNRAYVTDNIVKRPDFPKPVIDFSQKTRRWRKADVMNYRPKRAAMSSADSRK